MEFFCTQANLNKGINLVGKIVSVHGTLPILNNILLATDKGRVKISATDLEIGINTWIGAKVEKEGLITVPARLLQEFINTNNDETVSLKLDNTTLNLKSKKYKANIKGIDASEFPVIPNIKKKIFAEIAVNDLGRAISQVAFAAAIDETRPVLTGILFKFGKNELRIVATDSYRLAERTIKLESAPSRDAQFIMPQRAILELNRVLAAQPGKVEIYLEENQILFVVGDIEFTSRLIEGSFPDYTQIIPQKSSTEAVVNKNDFANSIKMASFFARESANNIKLTISKEELQIIAASPQIGDNISNLNAKTTGSVMDISFNAKFILDFLNVIDEETISIKASDKASPAVFLATGHNDYIYIIMPLRIEE